MPTTRLEAFSDAVIAIVITIMVLGLEAPAAADWTSLRPALPGLLTYVLSFVYLGIYWNNHHHMFHLVERLNGAILWANLHLLFWLSLVPFVTAWMGRTHLAPKPTAAYGVVLLMAAAAWSILQGRIVAHEGADSRLAQAIGSGRKETASLLLYVAAVPLAFVRAEIAAAVYAVVALLWLVPDRRIEAAL